MKNLKKGNGHDLFLNFDYNAIYCRLYTITQVIKYTDNNLLCND